MRAAASARKSRTTYEQNAEDPLHRTGERETSIQFATGALVHFANQLESEERVREREEQPVMMAKLRDDHRGDERCEREERHFEPREVFAEADGHGFLVAGFVGDDVAKVVDDEQHARERSRGESGDEHGGVDRQRLYVVRTADRNESEEHHHERSEERRVGKE